MVPFFPEDECSVIGSVRVLSGLNVFKVLSFLLYQCTGLIPNTAIHNTKIAF